MSWRNSFLWFLILSTRVSACPVWKANPGVTFRTAHWRERLSMTVVWVRVFIPFSALSEDQMVYSDHLLLSEKNSSGVDGPWVPCLWVYFAAPFLPGCTSDRPSTCLAPWGFSQRWVEVICNSSSTWRAIGIPWHSEHYLIEEFCYHLVLFSLWPKHVSLTLGQF